MIYFLRGICSEKYLVSSVLLALILTSTPQAHHLAEAALPRWGSVTATGSPRVRDKARTNGALSGTPRRSAA